MRIDAVELRQVEMPYLFPFETSFGREDTKVCLLVRVRTDGLEGWGEAPVMRAPLYNEETLGTAWHVLEEFIIPRVLGRTFDHPSEFPPLVANLRRHHMAKAGLEAALWDLYSQAHRVPLTKALGGTRESVAVGVSLGIEPTMPALLGRIETFLGQGFRRIKIKIKPGWDVDVVRAVRRQFGDILLQVDANSAYALEDAPVFVAMDDYDLLLIEQPLAEDDIIDHAQLQRRLRTPVCLDESIVTAEDARKAIGLGA
ncbi:MAG: o-succinylbenzoate synthase, partial [Armatimonadetes bacterium]|nr:o-succinylbenzoate synthase [Armatimonadota bacterium]